MAMVVLGADDRSDQRQRRRFRRSWRDRRGLRWRRGGDNRSGRARRPARCGKQRPVPCGGQSAQRHCPKRIPAFCRQFGTGRDPRAGLLRRIRDGAFFGDWRVGGFDLRRLTISIVDGTGRRRRRQGRPENENCCLRPHHSDCRHWPATPIVIRIRPVSGSPKSSGDWIESFSMKRYGIPASMS